MEPQPQVGKLIQEARERDPKWTQAKLAQVAGVNVETIIRAEAGANLRLATFYKISAALEEKTGMPLRFGTELGYVRPTHSQIPDNIRQKTVSDGDNSVDNPGQIRDNQPRENRHMADRRLGRFELDLVDAGASVKRYGPEFQKRLLDDVSELAAKLVLEARGRGRKKFRA